MSASHTALTKPRKQPPKASRRMLKAVILFSVFVAAFSSTGGLGVLAALIMLGVWLFLDIQDCTATDLSNTEPSETR